MPKDRVPIGAEARGRRRALKAELARLYAPVDNALPPRGKAPEAVAKLAAGSQIKRAIARYEVAKALGPGVHFEMAMNEERSIVWSVLHPRKTLVADEVDREEIGPGDLQDCISVDYFAAGRLPAYNMFGVMTGLWSIAFKDHAIGRLFERARGCDAVKVLLEAHRAMLRARVPDLEALINDREKAFLLPAGDGAFVCRATLTADVSQAKAPMMCAIADTYLDAGQLRDDQRPIAVDAKWGENRVGDRHMLPPPFRRIETKVRGDKIEVRLDTQHGGAPPQQAH